MAVTPYRDESKTMTVPGTLSTETATPPSAPDNIDPALLIPDQHPVQLRRNRARRQTVMRTIVLGAVLLFFFLPLLSMLIFSVRFPLSGEWTGYVWKTIFPGESASATGVNLEPLLEGLFATLKLAVFTVVLMLVLLVVCTPLHLFWPAVGAGRWWPRVFLAGVGMIAGLHIRVRGQRARGALLLANHVTWLDIPALSHVTGTAFVAHDGLAAFPFLKWLCEMNDTVFIARHDRGSVATQVQQVRAAIVDHGCLTLFPEGTTSDGTRVLPLKSSLIGAVHQALGEDNAEITVWPLAIAYTGRRGIPGGRIGRSSLAWYGDTELAPHLAEVLNGGPLDVVLTWGEPIRMGHAVSRKEAARLAEKSLKQALATAVTGRLPEGEATAPFSPPSSGRRESGAILNDRTS